MATCTVLLKLSELFFIHFYKYTDSTLIKISYAVKVKMLAMHKLFELSLVIISKFRYHTMWGIRAKQDIIQ